MLVLTLPARLSRVPAGMLSWLALWVLGWVSFVSADDNITQPISIFRSRPDLHSPILKVFEQKRDLVAPGYYFVCPYQQIQESVHIYDNDQNLIWTGFGAAGPGICHAPQTCQYKGETHLCFFQGTQMIGWGHGHGIIMNKHYQIVKSIEPGSYQASSDMHEFRVIHDGKSALMTQYLRGVHDLCDHGICWGLGYVQQGAFQEVDLETGKVLFEWRSLDHVGLDESYVGPGTTEISGSGEQPHSPWDYFHINSIDKNDDGDYLISARHVSCIYKISGKDGHVIWRFNGARSDYHLVDFGFGFQHDARFVSENEDETVMTIFDNASNGFNQTERHSSGLVVRLDHKTKLAHLLKRYEPPVLNGGQHISKSQGNFQQLPNGNVLLGWGNDAFWTEYTQEGEVAFYGMIGSRNVMNYRTHKFDNWVGIPLTKPALWTYSKTGSRFDRMFFYASWNGATEVRHWRFHWSDSKEGPWTLAAMVVKSGFETIYQYDMSPKYAYAEALDENLFVLGTSEIQQTYIPNVKMLDYCDDLACQFMPTGEELRKLREPDQNLTAEEDQEPGPETPPPSAKDRRMKQIFIGAFSGLGGLVVLAIIFAARNYLSISMHKLRQRLSNLRASQQKGLYTHLSNEEHDSIPMAANAR